jgi:DHA2 family methylenomycin A resistance protein-like MFS transporter
VALSAGPVLGGLLVAVPGWRLLFWLNVPPVAAAILAGLRVVPGRRPGRGRRVIVERRAVDPMLPPALLRSRQFVGANLVAGAMNFVGLGAPHPVPAAGTGHSLLEAAVRILPGFRPLSLLAPVSGRLTGLFGPRPLMISGLAVGVLALLNLLRVGPASRYLTVLPTWFGLGLGMGLVTAAVVAAAVRPPTGPGSPAGSTTPRARPPARSASPCSAHWRVNRATTRPSPPACTARACWGRGAAGGHRDNRAGRALTWMPTALIRPSPGSLRKNGRKPRERHRPQ